MFANIISLFITHSALGIFNHLCICAGAVAYSKSGVLTLEPRILLRECTFYSRQYLIPLCCAYPAADDEPEAVV
eukprot:gene33621-9559_t